jgi:hypothetical protein
MNRTPVACFTNSDCAAEHDLMMLRELDPKLFLPLISAVKGVNEEIVTDRSGRFEQVGSTSEGR